MVLKIVFASLLAFTPTSLTSAQSINPNALYGQRTNSAGGTTNIMMGMIMIPAGVQLTRDTDNPAAVSLGITMIGIGIMMMVQGSADNSAASQAGTTAGVSAGT